MALFQRLCKKVLIPVCRKKYYSMHYRMWDYIAVHLYYDSDELLNNANYIGRLKKTFLELNNCKKVYLNCFLCDLYYGTRKEPPKCVGCPLYKLQHKTCLAHDSLFNIVDSTFNERDKRIEAAKKIRDCVL